MRKEVLIVILIILAMPIVLASTLTATTPDDSASYTTTGNVTFNCTALAGTDITNLALNINITGTFENNYSVTGTGTDLTLEYTIYELPNGTYNWNCIETDNAILQATTNRTFTVNVPPSFSGTIPDQEFVEGATLSNAFDLDTYFHRAEGYTVSGNSTITVTIGTDNQVSFSATTNDTETITFTSGVASSNAITVNASQDVASISCSTIPPQTWPSSQNETIDLDDYCDGVTNITYTSTAPTNYVITITGSDVIIIPKNSFVGNETITFTASGEGTTTDTNNITLKTTAVNAPTISSYSPTSDPTLTEGETQVFSITKTGNGTISVKWYIDDVVQSGETADTYSYTGATAGTYTIKAEATSGGQTTTQSWSVTINAESEIAEEIVDEESIIGEQQETEECGNGVCAGDENCGTCASDCSCGSGQICEANACVQKSDTKKIIVIAVALISLLIIGGATAYYFISQNGKPEEETTEEPGTVSLENTEIQPAANISDFYKKETEPATQEDPGAAYIKSMKAKGLTDEKIKQALKAKKWTDKQIDDAFSKV